MTVRYRLIPVFDDMLPPKPPKRWRLADDMITECPRAKRSEHDASCSICHGRPYKAGYFVTEEAS